VERWKGGKVCVSVSKCKCQCAHPFASSHSPLPSPFASSPSPLQTGSTTGTRALNPLAPPISLRLLSLTSSDWFYHWNESPQKCVHFFINILLIGVTLIGMRELLPYLKGPCHIRIGVAMLA
jgi:hypothetical protein